MLRRVATCVTVIGAVAFGLGVPTSSALAATDSAGYEHWLMFEENEGTLQLSLLITGATATSGTVSGPQLDPISFSVTPGQITTVNVPSRMAVVGSQQIASQGIKVAANAEVTVYGLNRAFATTDAFLGLPLDLLGTGYIVLDAPNTTAHTADAAQFGIVATRNDTVIQITPRGSGTSSLPALISITLDAGQTYQLQNTGPGTANLTGTEIEASEPVAVFAGNRCTNLPGTGGFLACDHNVEQLFPKSSWGTHFVTAPLATRKMGDTFRLVAQADGTDVYVDGTITAKLDRGDYYESILDGAHEWQSSAPILLGQYSNSSSYDSVTADPFMTLVPPTEQFLTHYTVATPPSGFANNFVGLVAPTKSISGITVDGTAIDPNLISRVGESEFSAAQVPVSAGTHNLSGTAGFGLTVYGFDNHDSYGYPGGLSLAPIAVDSDHDSLPDVWETNGYDYEGVHVPLNEWGADPHRKDLFLQLDWMTPHWAVECNAFNFWSGCVSVEHDFAPSKAKLEALVGVFARSGINLHIDAGPRSPSTNGQAWPAPKGGQKIPYAQYFVANGRSAIGALADAHDQYLPDERGPAFHFGILGDHPWSGSGSSRTGFSQIPFDTFFVSAGVAATDTQTVRTIMHEFGHTLGLKHGGPLGKPDSDLNCKPAYHSVMNYLYQNRGIAMDYSSDASTGNPPPTLLDLKDKWGCDLLGGENYPTSDYDVYKDWPDSAWDSPASPLVFNGGKIGALALGSLIRPIETTEATMIDLEDHGLAADDGDGGVEVAAPTVLFAGLDNQRVTLRAHNPGNVDADYTVTAEIGDESQRRSVTIPAHGTVDLDLDAGTVRTGALMVTATISRASNSEVLATRSVEIPVLSVDAETAQSLLHQADSAGSDVPADIKARLVADLTRAVDQFGNTAPTASEITLATIAGTPTTGKLLGSDGDGDPLTYTVTTPPSHGSAVIIGDKVQYTPAAGYVGSDAFAYAASDGKASSSPATAHVTVAAPPQPTIGLAIDYGHGVKLLAVPVKIKLAADGVVYAVTASGSSGKVSATIKLTSATRNAKGVCILSKKQCTTALVGLLTIEDKSIGLTYVGIASAPGGHAAVVNGTSSGLAFTKGKLIPHVLTVSWRATT